MVKTHKYLLPLLFLILFFFTNTAPAADNASDQKKQEATGVIAYYFHGNFRCATCRAIEQLSRESIEKNFKSHIKSGKLTFLVINIDEPGNKHFIQDYQLITRSLVITRVKNGKEIEWKNLPGVWKYVRDEQAFDNYVKNEIQSYLQGS